MLLALLLGIAGFALYFAYDINSFTLKNPLLNMGFALGTLLIGAATVLGLWQAGAKGCFGGAGDILLLPAALAFGALIYCLFFALPFEATYVTPENGRRVYDGGVYALCRHPGIWCFFAMQLFAGLSALPDGYIFIGVTFSALNAVYAWFQDRVTFPATFCDYEEYRRRVPFLIPNRKSIRSAWRGLHKAGQKGGKK